MSAAAAVPARRNRVSTGMEFRKVIADANALWRVMGKHDTKTWIVEVQPETIDIPDGSDGMQTIDCTDYVGHRDVMTSEQILAAYNSAVTWAEIAAEQEAKRRGFLATLNAGDIVHHTESAPFEGTPDGKHAAREGRWVRYEYLGGDQFRPVALVGAWGLYETGMRYASGAETRGHYATKVVAGEPTTVNASSLLENPEAQKRSPRLRSVDPARIADLPALSLDIPPITEAEQRLARLHAAMTQGLERATGRGAGAGGADVTQSTDTAEQRLAAVERLLTEALTD